MYNETPVFIPVDIIEDVVKSIVSKLSWSSDPGGTDSKDLQGWILNFGRRAKPFISVEIFIEWL